jgi:hypothetical protein
MGFNSGLKGLNTHVLMPTVEHALYKVLTAVLMKTEVLWDMMPSSLVKL